MVPVGVNVAVINAGRMSQDNADAPRICDSAILDYPVLPHSRPDSACLQVQDRRRPVCSRMHEMKAIDSNVLQTGDFSATSCAVCFS